MTDELLTVLKFCFLALLYLFLFRVVRVVTLELKADKIAVPLAALPVTEAPVSQPKRSRGARDESTLVIVAPESREGETFLLDQEITVGRAPGCGIVLADDTFASQVHARIYRQGGKTYVEDLGSTNGTLLNGERISGYVRVRRGDRVQFGQTIAELTR